MKQKISFFKKEPIFTLENAIGLLLAILIIFDLKVEENISKLLNTPLRYYIFVVSSYFIIYFYESYCWYIIFNLFI